MEDCSRSAAEVVARPRVKVKVSSRSTLMTRTRPGTAADSATQTGECEYVEGVVAEEAVTSVSLVVSVDNLSLDIDKAIGLQHKAFRCLRILQCRAQAAWQS